MAHEPVESAGPVEEQHARWTSWRASVSLAGSLRSLGLVVRGSPFGIDDSPNAPAGTLPGC